MNRDFAQAVYDIVKLIPYGRVTSYGAIAKHIGSPQSSRAVGWLLNNSLEYNLPAHRVVNRNGVLTGKKAFSENSTMQSRLEKEGVEVKDEKIVNFKTLFWNPSDELHYTF